MTNLWTWLCLQQQQQQQLCLGQTCVHAHSPAVACRRADPILWGGTVCSQKLSSRCAREGGERESKGEQGREGSLPHALLEALRSSQTAGAARWLACSLRGNVRWLYSLNCWRTAMTSHCCFYMLLLIGTNGKCTWLAFFFFFFLILNIAKQIADKLQ